MLALLVPGLGMGATTTGDQTVDPGVKIGLHYGPRRPASQDDMTYTSGPAGPDA